MCGGPDAHVPVLTKAGHFVNQDACCYSVWVEKSKFVFLQLFPCRCLNSRRGPWKKKQCVICAIVFCRLCKEQCGGSADVSSNRGIRDSVQIQQRVAMATLHNNNRVNQHVLAPPVSSSDNPKCTVCNTEFQNGWRRFWHFVRQTCPPWIRVPILINRNLMAAPAVSQSCLASGPFVWCHAPVFGCGTPLWEEDKKNRL